MDRLERRVRKNMRNRVQRGAALLDKAMPTWFKKINLKTLDLSNCERCMAGQLSRHSATTKADHADYAEYALAIKNRFGVFGSLYGDSGFITQHGFDTSEEAHRYYGAEESYKVLEQMWVREIRRRLREAEAAKVT